MAGRRLKKAPSGEPRAPSGEPRAPSGEPRAPSGGPRPGGPVAAKSACADWRAEGHRLSQLAHDRMRVEVRCQAAARVRPCFRAELAYVARGRKRPAHGEKA